MDRLELWQRYRQTQCTREELGLTLDISRIPFPQGYLTSMEGAMESAFSAMAALEGGAIANPEEGRRVGHYWLRAPELAPDREMAEAIRGTQERVMAFAEQVHNGAVGPAPGQAFTDLLVIGVGGSALGPQLLADALGQPGHDAMTLHFFDNTDPDGMARCLATIGQGLATTLVLVISKSGSTAETRNGMLVARNALEAAGLAFPARAVAITGEGSKLDVLAKEEGWRARFPMWDWVGGRTSVTSAVGLLPAALQGLDVEGLLAGAAACDEATRDRHLGRNPAALLALMWYFATGGKGEKAMVILPYRDRLLYFSRYLQQLVMESLGKEKDLDGAQVEQGLTVYGNKGSTDQHAFVQQLRDGLNNFFVTFVEVLEDTGETLEVEPGVHSGDYLRGFLLGTRRALTERERPSLTLTLDRLDARALGVLIALYERAVGFYASLIHVNAYHQPGVEAGKKAAAEVLALQREIVAHLAATEGARTAEEIARDMGRPQKVETVFQILRALAANGRGIHRLPHVDPTLARWVSS